MPLMNWKDEAYLRKAADGSFIPIERYNERSRRQRGFLGLSKFEYKLLIIAGVGFFLDSYDLFIVNLVSPVWQYEYWHGHYPSGLRGLVNAAANIGNIFGQILFGFVGDILGRKFVYGKELIITIIGMILVISLPNSIPTPTLKMIWLFCWRLFMGIGIGGDYPMSAAVISERGHLHRRGSLLALIFSNQGLGTLAGSICTIIILACFEKSLNVEGEYGQLDAVWRIQMGLALVPALAVLPFRLTMPEGLKYLESKELNSATSSPTFSTSDNTLRHSEVGSPNLPAAHARIETNTVPVIEQPKSKAKWDTFIVYFKEWRHLKLLIGTASTWFLLDIAFYGVNLNQSVILAEIGFSKGSNEYHTLMKNAIGNLIIAAAGYVPGYFVTAGLVEVLGRKWIQIQGFLVTALLFGVLAGAFHHLSTAAKFVCFAFAQFFFNFGANSTTFIFSGEVYPSRVRGSAFGVSAAAGKLGAILAALLFNFLSSNVIGLPNVLWIFFACNILGALATIAFLPETKGRDADLIDYQEVLAAQASMNAAVTVTS